MTEHPPWRWSFTAYGMRGSKQGTDESHICGLTCINALLDRPLPRPDPRGEILNAVDERLEAEGVEEVEGVVSAGEFGVHDRGGGDGAQGGDEGLGVLGVHQFVQVAVCDEEGWCVCP